MPLNKNAPANRGVVWAFGEAVDQAVSTSAGVVMTTVVKAPA